MVPLSIAESIGALHSGRAVSAARTFARTAGEKHPYETDTATVLRYFDLGADCAEAQRLSMQ